MFPAGKILRSNLGNLFVLQSIKRYKYKKKWASNRAEKPSTELALNHYDFHIGRKLGDGWPSIRLALLSQPRHCAVLNNFCENFNEYLFELAENGGFDFVERYHHAPTYGGKYSLLRTNKTSQGDDVEDTKISDNHDDGDKISGESSSSSSSSLSHRNRLVSSKSELHSFMPATRILSDREKLHKLEFEQNVLPDITNDDADGDGLYRVIPSSSTSPHIPAKLKAIIYSRGDVSKFQPAKMDKKSGKLSYYLMDGASILPTLALDLFPNCSVLDMCAAPGGKTYAMLQTMLPETVVCLDRSYNRMVRLKDTMRLYFPRLYVESEKVKVKLADASNFGFLNEAVFDRVLVDVPCFADRHSVTEDDNNWFKSSRQGERLLLQQTQQQLLVSAVKACKPGGIIVYSTCTLSPPQNDGTVRAAIENLYTNHGIEVSVVDTGPLAAAYDDYFNFNQDRSFCSLGQLVLPNVTANFGPIYFCKMMRMK